MNFKTFAAGLSLLVLCATAQTVRAGDRKAYNGTFCDPVGGFENYAHRPHRYRAFDTQVATCPIIRDDDDLTALPMLAVEGFHGGSGTSDYSCSVWWMNEDSTANTIRGASQLLSTSSTGMIQLHFDSLSEYIGWGDADLTSGGEGTMAFRCHLEDGDDLIQYTVEEALY